MIGLATRKELLCMKYNMRDMHDDDVRLLQTKIDKLNVIVQEFCPHKKVYKGETKGEGILIFPNYNCLLCGKSFEELPKGSKLVKFECGWKEVKE